LSRRAAQIDDRTIDIGSFNVRQRTHLLRLVGRNLGTQVADIIVPILHPPADPGDCLNRRVDSSRNDSEQQRDLVLALRTSFHQSQPVGLL
jgi:hypothetical protein